MVLGEPRPMFSRIFSMVGPLAFAQKRIGGKFHIAPADAAGGRTIAGWGWGRFRHVINNTVYSIYK